MMDRGRGRSGTVPLVVPSAAAAAGFSGWPGWCWLTAAPVAEVESELVVGEGHAGGCRMATASLLATMLCQEQDETEE